MPPARCRSALAERFDLPQFTPVTDVTIAAAARTLRGGRDLRDGFEVPEVPMPAGPIPGHCGKAERLDDHRVRRASEPVIVARRTRLQAVRVRRSADVNLDP